MFWFRSEKRDERLNLWRSLFETVLYGMVDYEMDERKLAVAVQRAAFAADEAVLQIQSRSTEKK